MEIVFRIAIEVELLHLAIDAQKAFGETWTLLHHAYAAEDPVTIAKARAAFYAAQESHYRLAIKLREAMDVSMKLEIESLIAKELQPRI